MEPFERLVTQAKADHLDRAVRHQAFGQLVTQFQAWAYACAYAHLQDNHLAQDATQEAFITAYQKLGQLQEPRAFPTWLRRIVHTQCSRLRRDKRVVMTDMEEAANIPTFDFDPATHLEANDLKARVLAAINDLPGHEQDVVRLFYLQGYSIKETARLLQLPDTTIKKRLQYARRKLRGTVAEIYGIHLMAHYPGCRGMLDNLLVISLRLIQPHVRREIDTLNLNDQSDRVLAISDSLIVADYD